MSVSLGDGELTSLLFIDDTLLGDVGRELWVTRRFTRCFCRVNGLAALMEAEFHWVGLRYTLGCMTDQVSSLLPVIIRDCRNSEPSCGQWWAQ
jgi:hypothetical protein